MPKCYLLAVTNGSSLDRYSNNVTLFNLIEQLNFPKQQPPPPGAVLPLEIHAYFSLAPHELNHRFEVRFTLVAATGLETVTDAFSIPLAWRGYVAVALQRGLLRLEGTQFKPNNNLTRLDLAFAANALTQ